MGLVKHNLFYNIQRKVETGNSWSKYVVLIQQLESARHYIIHLSKLDQK